MSSNPANDRMRKPPRDGSGSSRRSRRIEMTFILATFAGLFLTVLIGALAWIESANPTTGANLSPSPFNEQRAFEDLEKFAALGPRPPGSNVHYWTHFLIHLSLLSAGVNVNNVDFDSSAPTCFRAFRTRQQPQWNAY